MGSTDKPAGPPDYRITGFEPANAVTEDSYELVASAEDDLAVVAAHHNANGRDTYFVLYDATAIYGHPAPPRTSPCTSPGTSSGESSTSITRTTLSCLWHRTG